MPKLTAIAVCLLAYGATAHATVLVSTDLGALSRDAAAIARGRVVAVEPRWSDNHRTIETIVSLEVETYLKGAFGSVVRFRVPGGLLGRYRSILVGAPQFAVDQRVVVFLGAHAPGMPYVLGLSDGVFRLAPAENGRGWMVTPPPLIPVATPTRVVRGDVARHPVRLIEFERRVRALAAGGK
jgi:hypothetical protein